MKFKMAWIVGGIIVSFIVGLAAMQAIGSFFAEEVPQDIETRGDLIQFIKQMEVGQGEMTEEAHDGLTQSLAQMETVLGQLRAKVKSTDNASRYSLHLLEASQAAWIQSMDATLAMYWPIPPAAQVVVTQEMSIGQGWTSGYGSIFPMCWAGAKAGMINSRIEALRLMLDIEEGDVCAPRWPAVSEN